MVIAEKQVSLPPYKIKIRRRTIQHCFASGSMELYMDGEIVRRCSFSTREARDLLFKEWDKWIVRLRYEHEFYIDLKLNPKKDDTFR